MFYKFALPTLPEPVLGPKWTLYRSLALRNRNRVCTKNKVPWKHRASFLQFALPTLPEPVLGPKWTLYRSLPLRNRNKECTKNEVPWVHGETSDLQPEKLLLRSFNPSCLCCGVHSSWSRPSSCPSNASRCQSWPISWCAWASLRTAGAARTPQRRSILVGSLSLVWTSRAYINSTLLLSSFVNLSCHFVH